MDEEPLWTLKDVAKFLSLKPETIRKMVSDNRITRADGVVKLGRMTRFKREVVIGRLLRGRARPLAEFRADFDHQF